MYSYKYVIVMLRRIYCSIKEKMATGYKNGKEVTHSDLGWAAPAGQMYSTVNDLMKVNSCWNFQSSKNLGLLASILRYVCTKLHISY